MREICRDGQMISKYYDMARILHLVNIRDRDRESRRIWNHLFNLARLFVSVHPD